MNAACAQRRRPGDRIDLHGGLVPVLGHHIVYDGEVKIYRWDVRKNEQLKATRDLWNRGEMMSALDRYEKSVLSAFEAGKLGSVVTNEMSLRRYREYARATLTKNKRVNVRLSTQDLSDIQARAVEEGVPYQTLISSVLHKFLTGRFVERRSRLASRSSARGKQRRAA